MATLFTSADSYGSFDSNPGPDPARIRTRRVTVVAEIVVEVSDPAALERAALADIAVTEFGVIPPGTTMDDAREAEAVEVRDDSVAALAWLLDPERTVAGIPGVVVSDVSWEIFDGDATGDDAESE